jgi:hypothetical protein
MGRDKRSLQTISFFDSQLSYDKMNMDVIKPQQQEQRLPQQYTMEDGQGKGALLDISSLMMHRYNHGYKVD